MFDLGPCARVVFSSAYLALQGALALTAAWRSDAAFGFHMFSESSTMRIELRREVDAPSGHGTIVVPAVGGVWSAHDKDGTLHRFAWRDRVRDPIIGEVDWMVPAAYGSAAQLFRLQRALDDVALHCPEDTETRALIAEVVVRKNGREGAPVQLTSARRGGAR